MAWSWSRLGPAEDVFAAPTDGSRLPLRLTKTSDGDTVVVSWTPDGKSVLVSQDNDGDERVRLFRVRLDKPGTMEPLTEPNPNISSGAASCTRTDAGSSTPRTSTRRAGEEIEADMPLQARPGDWRDARRWSRPRREAWPIPSSTGRGPTCSTRAATGPGREQVWLVDVEGRNDREILNFGDRGQGPGLVAARRTPGYRRRRGGLLPPAGRLGRMDDDSVRWLIDDPKRNIGYAFAPPNDGPMVVIGAENARVRASLLDPDTGARDPSAGALRGT